MNFSSVSGKNWLLKKFDSSHVAKLVENYPLSEIAAKLLSIRKNNIENIDLFLNPKIKNLLPNPLILKDMNSAIERSYKSVIKDDLIGIFGDYDVDGASSTAILARYFLSINKKIKTYIPDRHKEGYGPSIKSFKNLITNGVKIIFTVDCGTLSYEPIALAQKLNIDVNLRDLHSILCEILPENLWNSEDIGNSAMALDCVTTVPEDFFSRNDKYGMAFSMEGRFPFASKKYIQYCLS